MKQTVQPATRNDLKDELRKFSTKDDLAHAIKDLASKADLAHAIKDLASKDDLAHAIKDLASKDDLAHAIKDLASKDDMISFKDAILKEIKDMRDEVAIVGGQRDMLEDHEQRIETIEKQLHIPSLP